MRRILLLANPLATSRGGWSLPSVVRIFEEAGIEVDVQETEPNRGAGQKASLAAEKGVDAVIVCGGDGTVFDVVQGLAGTEVPLGIIPLGTGNVLAQNLKIPLNPTEAARWLLKAIPRTVPLGKIVCQNGKGTESWFFAMAAGMGLHAAMMQATRRGDKIKTGRMAYFSAGLKMLVSYPVQPIDLEITTVEGERLQRRASEIVAVRVAELNLWRPGGDLEFPFLRLATVEGGSRWRLAKASFQALFLGAGKRDKRFNGVAAANYEDVLKVECKPIPGMHYKIPIAVEADGEVLGLSRATIEMAGLSVNLLAAPAEA